LLQILCGATTQLLLLIHAFKIPIPCAMTFYPSVIPSTVSSKSANQKGPQRSSKESLEDLYPWVLYVGVILLVGFESSGYFRMDSYVDHFG
jgi:hypothetical protein